VQICMVAVSPKLLVIQPFAMAKSTKRHELQCLLQQLHEKIVNFFTENKELSK